MAIVSNKKIRKLENWKIGKLENWKIGKFEKELPKKTIFLSRYRFKRKRLSTGDSFKASKRLRTGDSSVKGKSEKIKLNERNIFLSRDSCSCRAKEATYWGFVQS